MPKTAPGDRRGEERAHAFKCRIGPLEKASDGSARAKARDKYARGAFHVKLDCSGPHTLVLQDQKMEDGEHGCVADITRLPPWLRDWAPVRKIAEANHDLAKIFVPLSCNLVYFPKVQELETNEKRNATVEELCVLCAVLLDLVHMPVDRDCILSENPFHNHYAGGGGGDSSFHEGEAPPPRSEHHSAEASYDAKQGRTIEMVMALPDCTGESIIHALLLGASLHPAPLQLTYTMFTVEPRLMALVHLGIDPGERHPPQCSRANFKGENCLHMAIVNLEERLLCAMLNLAARSSDLNPMTELHDMLHCAWPRGSSRAPRHILGRQRGGRAPSLHPPPRPPQARLCRSARAQTLWLNASLRPPPFPLALLPLAQSSARSHAVCLRSARRGRILPRRAQGGRDAEADGILRSDSPRIRRVPRPEERGTPPRGQPQAQVRAGWVVESADAR